MDEKKLAAAQEAQRRSMFCSEHFGKMDPDCPRCQHDKREIEAGVAAFFIVCFLVIAACVAVMYHC